MIFQCITYCIIITARILVLRKNIERDFGIKLIPSRSNRRTKANGEIVIDATPVISSSTRLRNHPRTPGHQTGCGNLIGRAEAAIRNFHLDSSQSRYRRELEENARPRSLPQHTYASIHTYTHLRSAWHGGHVVG